MGFLGFFYKQSWLLWLGLYISPIHYCSTQDSLEEWPPTDMVQAGRIPITTNSDCGTNPLSAAHT